MNILYAAVLGLIQGLTEFLPVSSSGHLVLAQSLIPSFRQPGVFFDVVLHIGTLFAVLYYFRTKILSLPRSYWMFLIVGTLPALLAGLLFGRYLETLFSSAKATAVQLVATGVMNIIVDYIPQGAKGLNIKNSFFVGIAQAISIIPGISRSGATIFSGVLLKIDRAKAAEFSFLLSVPAILGAMLYQLYSHGFGAIENPGAYLVGLMVSLVAGFISINLVFRFLLSKRFKIFGVYCILLGLIFLLV